MSWFSYRFRKVHVDFHTPMDTTINIDVKDFVDNLVKANVNVAVLFTKCHFGYSYYNTEIGHKHPGLKVDFFSDASKGCQDNDIKVIAYHSVGWDELQGKKHPDWIQRDSKDEAILRPWPSMCLNSPYKDSLLIPQLEEISRKYNPDAYWLDIVRISLDGCFCEYCKRRFKNEYGIELEKNTGSLHQEFKIDTIARFLKEVQIRLKAINPNVMIGVNGIGRLEDPQHGPKKLLEHVDYLTLESQPAWGGYDNQSFVARCTRTRGKPFEILTSRFYAGWGHWTLKPLDQMKYEFCQIMMNGGLVSCGDQISFDGRVEPSVYRRIGEAYAFIKEREEFCIEAESLSYIAVFFGPKQNRADINSLRGANKALTELHQQFEIIEDLRDLNKYRVLILPELGEMDEELIMDIKDFVKEGGSLLATFKSSYKVGRDFALGDCLGISYIEDSPYSANYVRLLDEIKDPDMDLPLLVYDVSTKVKITTAKPLARLVYPFIEPEKIPRMPPSSMESPYPAVTLNSYEKGRAVYISTPVFRNLWITQHSWLRTIIGNALSLITKDAPVMIKAPPSVEINLTKIKDKLLLHLLNYQAVKRTSVPRELWKERGSYEPIEEISPLYDIPVKIRAKAGEVTWEPGGTCLKFEQNGEYASTVIPKLDIHGILRIKE